MSKFILYDIEVKKEPLKKVRPGEPQELEITLNFQGVGDTQEITSDQISEIITERLKSLP